MGFAEEKEHNVPFSSVFQVINRIYVMNYTIIAQLSTLKMIGMNIVHENTLKIRNSSVINLIFFVESVSLCDGSNESQKKCPIE